MRYTNRKGAASQRPLDNITGNLLISHAPARAVPSAQRGLTSVFGMGTGGTLAVWSPVNLYGVYFQHSRLEHPRYFHADRQNISQRNRLGLARLVLNVHRCDLHRVNSMDKPNGRLVLVSCTHHCAFTSSLSTRSSSWALQGDLILERASRLYAFSGYHNRTSLPSRALGRTTGTQEVRPSRSSRTKDSPPQISYAHSR